MIIICKIIIMIIFTVSKISKFEQARSIQWKHSKNFPKFQKFQIFSKIGSNSPKSKGILHVILPGWNEARTEKNLRCLW